MLSFLEGFFFFFSPPAECTLSSLPFIRENVNEGNNYILPIFSYVPTMGGKLKILLPVIKYLKPDFYTSMQTLYTASDIFKVVPDETCIQIQRL